MTYKVLSGMLSLYSLTHFISHRCTTLTKTEAVITENSIIQKAVDEWRDHL